ncbi:TlyA family RNA methyltransferase [Hyphomicrobium sp.]|uniref:TlyA family RNA methyltransferase n=1 Tax=Hyphomicrobium sp. TaxID=82 RepID=UPI0025C48126|nr:TlyA family RNA methyltransferase [Hyphomicrobium sp.]MCC7252265.1 TlyA family RNA methyltransferase [Hyphomicrobium sp.]
MGLRLDKALLLRGLIPTRSRARDLIVRGAVSVDGAVELKPGALVADDTPIALAESSDYVSRGGLKLEAALDAFGLDPQGRVALDVGASTGGFTDVLLRRGAEHVFAVDVGHGQFNPRLAADPRVTSLEGQDVRALTVREVPRPVEAIVADVSFISLEKALPAALGLAAPGAWLVALVKPQFEAGREAVGKGGIVRDASVREAQVDKIAAWIGGLPGWRVVGIVASPIAGGSGNQEFLLGARRDG